MTLKNKLLYEWVKKIHMYSGLLTFTAFVVWGVTGISAVFLPPPGQYTPPPVSSVHEIQFQGQANLDSSHALSAFASSKDGSDA